MPVFSAEKISYAAALLSNWKGREPQAVRDALDDLAALLAPLTLMDPNSVLVAVGSALPAGLIMPPGSILVRDLTTPTPDVKVLLVGPNRNISTNSAGNWRVQAFTSGRLVKGDALGGLESHALGNNRWLISSPSGAISELVTAPNSFMIGLASGVPLFVLVGLQTIAGRKAAGIVAHTFGDVTFLGKEKAGVDWGNLSMATSRGMLALKYSSYLVPPGLHADKLSTKTALGGGKTHFHYVGKAGGPITTATINTRVATAFGPTAQIWAEIGVFTGAFVPNGNASLTRRGFLNVAAIYNILGVKSDAVALTGVSEGDDLWVAFGSAGGTPYQLRGMFADDIQSGVHQSVVGQLSSLGSPVATTLESATKVPAWIGLAI